jgi:hypothetical protein
MNRFIVAVQSSPLRGLITGSTDQLIAAFLNANACGWWH